jgi:hypothetical protein
MHLSRKLGLREEEASLAGGFEEQWAMAFVHGVGLGTGPGLGPHVNAVGFRSSGDAQEGYWGMLFPVIAWPSNSSLMTAWTDGSAISHIGAARQRRPAVSG